MTGIVQVCNQNSACATEGPPITVEPVFGSFSAALNVTNTFINMHGTGNLDINVMLCPSKKSIKTKKPCTAENADFGASVSMLVSDPRPPSSQMTLVVPKSLPPSGLVVVSGMAESFIAGPVAGAVIDIAWEFSGLTHQGACPPLLHVLRHHSAFDWLDPHHIVLTSRDG
jgi:hypothetical protein